MAGRIPETLVSCIEHLTIDHGGFVYWKDEQVEHYTPRWAYSEDAYAKRMNWQDGVCISKPLA